MRALVARLWEQAKAPEVGPLLFSDAVDTTALRNVLANLSGGILPPRALPTGVLPDLYDLPATFFLGERRPMPLRHTSAGGTLWTANDLHQLHLDPLVERLDAEGELDWLNEYAAPQDVLAAIANYLFEDTEPLERLRFVPAGNGRLQAYACAPYRDPSYLAVGWAYRTVYWPLICRLCGNARLCHSMRNGAQHESETLFDRLNEELHELGIEERRNLKQEVWYAKNGERRTNPWYTTITELNASGSLKAVAQPVLDQCTAEERPIVADLLQRLTHAYAQYHRIRRRDRIDPVRHLWEGYDEVVWAYEFHCYYWGINDTYLFRSIQDSVQQKYDNCFHVGGVVERWVNAQGQVVEQNDLHLFDLQQRIRELTSQCLDVLQHLNASR